MNGPASRCRKSCRARRRRSCSALSVFVVFLCLAALYESWTIPLAVLLTVPLGIVGAVVAAMLRGLPNDVYFTVGLITIIGLAAKDAILIIEFAKDLRKEGKPLVEATIEACRLRFRPILMTGLAFICGVLPMAIAHGAGGASQQSLGTVVMGGMIAVVILALLMVPVFFVSVQRVLAGDRETKAAKEGEAYGPPAPMTWHGSPPRGHSRAPRQREPGIWIARRPSMLDQWVARARAKRSAAPGHEPSGRLAFSGSSIQTASLD